MQGMRFRPLAVRVRANRPSLVDRTTVLSPGRTAFTYSRPRPEDTPSPRLYDGGTVVGGAVIDRPLED